MCCERGATKKKLAVLFKLGWNHTNIMFALAADIQELAQRYCDYVFSHAISTADSCRTYFNIHTQKPALARTSLTLSTFIDRLGSRNNILLVSFPSN